MGNCGTRRMKITSEEQNNNNTIGETTNLEEGLPCVVCGLATDSDGKCRDWNRLVGQFSIANCDGDQMTEGARKPAQLCSKYAVESEMDKSNMGSKFDTTERVKTSPMESYVVPVENEERHSRNNLSTRAPSECNESSSSNKSSEPSLENEILSSESSVSSLEACVQNDTEMI